MHIKNRTYNSVIKSIPYKEVTGYYPDIEYIRVLGLLYYVLKPKLLRKGKLDEKAYKGLLVGFDPSSSYLVYIPELDKVLSSRNVIIKKDLIYNNESTTNINNEDYYTLLEEESLDINIIRSYNQERLNSPEIVNNDFISDNSHIETNSDSF